ncbi:MULTISPECIES: hypothetical protein [Bacillus]|uniref:hypothetical protein n=1 Tax=Bacillus TaxID=1386 RepID=UPI001A7E540D|nr:MULTISPECIES: hypothetical protein [Bacillus]
MNEINETNEFTSFGQIRNVPMYLLRFGKNMHKASVAEQTAFKEKIKKHHDSKKIKMLLDRLEEGIDNHKASSHFTTAFFTILAFILGSTLNYGLTLADAEGTATLIILMTFYTAIIVWAYQSITHSNKLKKANRYITLLQECMDEISEKKSKRRFLKLTNKYRTP